LEQFRLCIAKLDYIRAEIVAKKINAKTLAKEDMQPLKLRYYDLMVQYDLHSGRYFEVCHSYREIYNTPIVQAEPAQWQPALKNAVLFAILSPFDSEISDILHRTNADKKVLLLPNCKRLLDAFTTDELQKWPLPDEAVWKVEKVFTGEKGAERWNDFHKRVVQHNIRTLSKYYTRITTSRLSHFLQLDEAKSEVFLSEMVSSKQLYCKIDRPTGIVVFQRRQTPNDLLQNWAEDIDSLLGLVEDTCHLINRENMLLQMRESAAALTAAEDDKKALPAPSPSPPPPSDDNKKTAPAATAAAPSAAPGASVAPMAVDDEKKKEGT